MGLIGESYVLSRADKPGLAYAPIQTPHGQLLQGANDEKQNNDDEVVLS